MEPEVDDRALIATGAVVLVNVFTPKAGQLDAFVAAQTAEYERLKGQVDGALGNRLVRALDGSKAVNVAYFESEAKYGAIRQFVRVAVMHTEPWLEFARAVARLA